MATPEQIRRRGRLGLILGTILAAGLIVVGASADDIKNDLDGTAGVMTLVEGGSAGATQLTVLPRNGDGKNGCNLTGAKTLAVSVNSSDASVATASPSSLTFASCGDVKTVTVTPGAAGAASVTLTQVSNDTGGSFNLGPAAFTVNVVSPPNTPPVVTVTGVEHGASYAKGSVPAAACSVADAEDGNSTFAAFLGDITGAYASDGLGNQTATCSYTDAGGLTQELSATYSIYDPSAPSVTYTINGTSPPVTADGTNGWWRSDVALVWSVSEAESPNSLSKTGCVDANVVEDQAEQTYSCSAASAGGAAGPVEVKIKRDGTKPTITGSRSPAANGFGWSNTDVVVSFACADNLSGIASCSGNETLVAEGRMQSVTGNAADEAGNVNAATVENVNIDKTAPNAPAVSADREADYSGGGGWYRDSVTVSFAAAGDPALANGDLGSGVDPATVPPSQVFDTSGSHTAGGTVKDKAGNESAPGSKTVQVDADVPVVEIACPSSAVLLGSSASASWTASDTASGLATPAAGSVALDTSSVGTKTATAPAAEDNVGHRAAASCQYSVIYDFRGFFRPVDNLPTLNVVKAGSGVPLKFSLNGDQGLNILHSGYPVSYKINCDTSAPFDTVEETVTAGGSSLSYDASVDQYVYVWKTDKAWAGTCRQLNVKLIDDTEHRANFKFTK